MNDSDAEIEDLLIPFGTSATNYVSIDDNVLTENTSLTITDLLPNAIEEHEEEVSLECDQQETISSNEALQYGLRLKQYFLNNNDAAGLDLISRVQMHVENHIVKKPKSKHQFYIF